MLESKIEELNASILKLNETIVGLVNSISESKPTSINDEKAVEEKPKTARKSRKKVAEEPKAEEPKVEEPKAEEPKAEEPKAEEPKAESSVSFDQMSTALIKIKTAHGVKEAKALIAEVGGVQQLKDVPEDKYQAVYDAACARLDELDNDL